MTFELHDILDTLKSVERLGALQESNQTQESNAYKYEPFYFWDGDPYSCASLQESVCSLQLNFFCV